MDRLAELKAGIKNDKINQSSQSNQQNQFNNFDQENKMPFFRNAKEILGELSSLDVNTIKYDKCKTKLIELRKRILELEKEKVYEEYFKQRKELLVMIREKFKEKLNVLNNNKLIETEKIKRETIRKIKIVSPNISNDDLEIACKNSDKFIQQKIATNDADSIIIKSFKDAQSKYNDVVILNGQIRELHELFIDFGIIVEDQGKHIDKIENNVLVTNEQIDQANKELEEALKIKHKIIWRQCCMCSVVLFILLIIGGIIVAVVFTNMKIKGIN